MDPLISVAEAEARIQASLTTLSAEDVSLTRAVGRQLLSPVIADRPLPPYTRAMMDGIAFHSASTGKPLRIHGIHAAGDPPPAPLPAGHAWEIMTGALMPDDCDTLVPYEDLIMHEDESGHRVASVNAVPVPGEFIHPVGSDARSGTVLVPAGTIIGAPEVAIAASVGHTTLTVPKLPRIGVLSTGNEAVHPAVTPEPWQIRRSNGPALAAIVDQLNLPLDFHHHAPDDPDELARLLDQALDSVNVLLISGGISRGARDLVRELLEDRLGKPVFHGVSQRPGKPLAFWAGPPDVFALPGNPVSALACFARFVRPALNQLQGLPTPLRRFRAGPPFEPLARLTSLTPVTLTPENKVIPRTPTNSGDFTSISQATGILQIPPEPDFTPDTPLLYFPFIR